MTKSMKHLTLLILLLVTISANGQKVTRAEINEKAFREAIVLNQLDTAGRIATRMIENLNKNGYFRKLELALLMGDSALMKSTFNHSCIQQHLYNDEEFCNQMITIAAENQINHFAIGFYKLRYNKESGLVNLVDIALCYKQAGDQHNYQKWLAKFNKYKGPELEDEILINQLMKKVNVY